MSQTLQIIAEVKAQSAKTTLSDLDKMIDKLRLKRIDMNYDKVNNATKAVKQFADEVGNLYTVTEQYNKSGGIKSSTVKVTEFFDKQTKSAKSSEDAVKKATKATEEHATKTKTAKTSVDEFGNGLEGASQKANALNTALSRLGQIAIANVTRAFREAFEEMKKVDQELVVVRKVTDASADEISRIQEKAYSTSKQYGVTASDYLTSVAEFSRAGYREQATGLAELATKLQLVGDVSQDVSNKFLIATDKSYKFNGDLQKLSLTIDKANEIDNNYATTIEKLASGMGIIAPVSAQLNVSLDETMAAVGTITAVTQRSGTEAARALRAIMLNIIGDTKTEIEDGATWTAGEIIGLRDLLKKYAPEIVEEAQKMGTVINPMEAIGALAKAYKDGMLTAQELTEKVSDIGGKLRTPQLLALIQNWDDMYLKMMDDISTAVGSADKEVENALTGWDAKINILKTSWTDFVQRSISTDFIKGFIDAITWLVDGVGSLGNALVIAGSLFLAFRAKAIAAFATDWIVNFAQKITPLIMNLANFGQALMGVGDATEVWGARIQLGASIVALAVTAAIVAINRYKKNLEDTIERGEKASSSILQIQELSGKYNELNSTAGNTEGAAEARQKLIDKLTAEGVWVDSVIGKYSSLEEKISAATQAALDNRRVEVNDAVKAASDNLNFTSSMSFGGTSVYNAADILGMGRNYASKNGKYNLFGFVDADRLVEVYDEAIKKRAEFARGIGGAPESKEDKQLRKFTETYRDAVEKYKAAKSALDALNGSEEDSAEKTSKAAESASAMAEANNELALSFAGLADDIAGATAALEAYNQALSGGEHGDTYKDYASAYKGAKDLYEKGLIGSKQFKAAMDLILPQDIRNQLGNDYKELGDYVFGEFANGAYEAMYGGGGDDFGARLASYLRDHAEGMEQVFEIINDNGSSFDVLIHNEEALAKILGVTTEQIYAWMDALDAYNSDVMLSTKDVKELIKRFGDLNSGVITDTTGLIQQLVQDGRTSSEIKNIIDQLAKAGQIDMGSMPEDLDGAIQKFQEIEESVKDMPKEVKVAIKTDPESNFFSKVLAEIKTLDGSTITIGIVPVINRISGGAKPSGLTGNIEYLSNWQGIDFANAGTSLINEDGAELIVRGKKAIIANGGNPTLFDLQTGDKVFNSAETRAILSSKDKNTKTKIGEEAKVGTGAKDETEPVRGISSIGGGIPYTDYTSAESNVKDKEDKDKEPKADKGKGKKKEEKTKDSDLLSMLSDYIGELLDTAKKALDTQIETIDAQIEKLKNEHDAQEEANEVEELRLKILEAEKALVDANVERTVRYFNKATGQWEWMADQKAVATAQKNLEDAQQAYYDKLEEIEYQAKLDELEAQKEALNKNYNNLSDAWNELKNDMSKALSDKDVLALAEILSRLGLTAASGSVAGVNTLISNINDFTGSFDNGGFAFGKGYLRKAITKGETILDDSITDRILSPRSNSQFTSFTNSLTKLFGMSSGDIGAKAQSLINSIDRSSSISGDTYYINGVRIGSDMVDRPLSEILSVLPIYAG